MTNQDIIDGFPILYKHPDMFDFSPPAAWLEIIREMSFKLVDLHEDIKIVQVKSKFGGLRVYPQFAVSPAANTIIREAEEKVYKLTHTL